MEVRFIQIVEVNSNLFGLDSCGQVWRKSSIAPYKWIAESMDVDENNNQKAEASTINSNYDIHPRKVL